MYMDKNYIIYPKDSYTQKRDEKSEFLYESDLLTVGDPGCTFL